MTLCCSPVIAVVLHCDALALRVKQEHILHQRHSWIHNIRHGWLRPPPDRSETSIQDDRAARARSMTGCACQQMA